MRRSVSVFAAVLMIVSACSASPTTSTSPITGDAPTSPGSPPAPSSMRMQADLMNKQLSGYPPVALTAGQFSQFSADLVRSAPDALAYKVNFGLSDVQWSSWGSPIDFGPCTGSLMISYISSGQGWSLSNVEPGDKLSCPQRDAQVAAEQLARARQDAASRAQFCAGRRTDAEWSARTNCANNHTPASCNYHYVPDAQCAQSEAQFPPQPTATRSTMVSEEMKPVK